MTVDIGRGQALAYRIASQGLAREAAVPAELGVLDLGVQETNVGSARLALNARLAVTATGSANGPATGAGSAADPLADPALSLLWTFRGAPHLHRTSDLAGLAAALWPAGAADAEARLAAERKAFRAAGIGGLDAFAAAAGAMRAAVTAPMAKGDVSAAVTARLPASYSYACRSCKATHVYGGLFQQAGLFAGVRLVAGRSPATLAPLDVQPPLPPPATGPGELLRAYLRLHGPASLAEAAGYLGTNRTAVRPAWPAADLAEVRLEGRRAWIPDEHLDALRQAAPPDPGAFVRLLPPSDPYLQARDRDVLVPARERQKAVWRILGNPGAVLAGTEVVAVWRARMGTRTRLDVTVEPFDRLPAAARDAITAEAERVAATRGAGDVRVGYDAS